MYLDDWPETYGDLVHVTMRPAEMLGPWNVDHHQAREGDDHRPVLYHFHSFRIFHPRWIQLCGGYNPPAAAPYYARYLEALDGIDRRLAERGISIESIVQRHPNGGVVVKGEKAVPVPVILITYATHEDAVRRALQAVQRDKVISGRPQVIRIEKN